jgi:hypothetical protein
MAEFPLKDLFSFLEMIIDWLSEKKIVAGN